MGRVRHGILAQLPPSHSSSQLEDEKVECSAGISKNRKYQVLPQQHQTLALAPSPKQLTLPNENDHQRRLLTKPTPSSTPTIGQGHISSTNQPKASPSFKQTTLGTQVSSTPSTNKGIPFCSETMAPVAEMTTLSTHSLENGNTPPTRNENSVSGSTPHIPLAMALSVFGADMISVGDDELSQSMDLISNEIAATTRFNSLFPNTYTENIPTPTISEAPEPNIYNPSQALTETSSDSPSSIESGISDSVLDTTTCNTNNGGSPLTDLPACNYNFEDGLSCFNYPIFHSPPTKSDFLQTKGSKQIVSSTNNNSELSLSSEKKEADCDPSKMTLYIPKYTSQFNRYKADPMLEQIIVDELPDELLEKSIEIGKSDSCLQSKNLIEPITFYTETFQDVDPFDIYLNTELSSQDLVKNEIASPSQGFETDESSSLTLVKYEQTTPTVEHTTDSIDSKSKTKRGRKPKVEKPKLEKTNVQTPQPKRTRKARASKPVTPKNILPELAPKPPQIGQHQQLHIPILNLSPQLELKHPKQRNQHIKSPPTNQRRERQILQQPMQSDNSIILATEQQQQQQQQLSNPFQIMNSIVPTSRPPTPQQPLQLLQEQYPANFIVLQSPQQTQEQQQEQLQHSFQQQRPPQQQQHLSKF